MIKELVLSHLCHVSICVNGCGKLSKPAGHLPVLTLTDLAALAGASPGRSQRGAALRLQRGSVDVDLAAAVLYRQPARTLHAVCGRQNTNS